VPVIAPVGFMDHAVAENVYAGNAMNRRMFFQYGVLLPRSPFGHVDQSIGKNVANGSVGLIEPNRYHHRGLRGTDGRRRADGVPEHARHRGAGGDEHLVPDLKAFWAAENITGTIHNIYTLRGALVRDALEWSKQINTALYRFGRRPR
jgi:alkyl sulfatase BDS1-like metallo-beta-lactamase superfamily hydrolase